MLYHVPRTCIEKIIDGNIVESQSRPIANFRDRAAYILLGEPGAGKSSLFEEEANNTENGLYISARDFIDLENNEWRGKTLFIDGLDEARAGRGDARTPLGAIRSKLDKLACKRFRISCREADWLGSLDIKDLSKVSPDQKITELRLESLTSDDINLILNKDKRVNDAENFIENVSRFGLSGLLDNPQTLDMLIDAVKGGQQWPSSKKEVYELACYQLASEFNDDHAISQTATIAQLIEASGFLCAVQLIANISGFAQRKSSEGRSCINDLAIPDNLQIKDALKTRLFNRIPNVEFSYVHRSVAEYLAAKFIAKKINNGLLFNRVLALTAGFDGGIVAALRGLMAWLSVHSEQAREHLIDVDPIGIIVNGDARLFSLATKKKLLNSVEKELEKKGNWIVKPFDAITTPDMASTLLALLSHPSRNLGKQNTLYCVLDGLCHSENIPELKQALLSVIRDQTYTIGVRAHALDAFINQHPKDTESLLMLADEIRDNKIDDDNSLLEVLLINLFPAHIPANDILQYLKPDKNDRSIGYSHFWNHDFVSRVTNEDLPILLDELSCRGSKFLQIAKYRDLFDVGGELLTRGLQSHAEHTEFERIYSWLSIGLDEYDHCIIDSKYQQPIREWIESQPNRYTGLLEAGFCQIQSLENVGFEIYKIMARLYSATQPNNLGLWWVEQALAAADFRLSVAYFQEAFRALVHQQGHEGLSLEFFVDFITKHPEFEETYRTLVFCPLDKWRVEGAQSRQNWLKQQKEELSDRLSFFNQHKEEIAQGVANPYIYHHLAHAYSYHYSDSKGKSGEERLSDYLNKDIELIDAARRGLRKILDRNDLPEIEDIFALAIKNREHYIRQPFLVCLKTLYKETPSILDSLSEELIRKALAFWYTYGAGNEPDWVKPLSLMYTELTANVFIGYVRAMLDGKKQHIHGLYQLAYDTDYREIARLTAIPLLEKYPARGYKDHTGNLECLLKAAINHADKAQILALLKKKLAYKGMDIAQHVYWLVTGIIIEPEIYKPILRNAINGKAIRINHLSKFLRGGLRINERYNLSVSTIGLIIELLAPRCSPDWPSGPGFVTQAMEEGDFVRILLSQLSADPNIDSGNTLDHLLTLPQLNHWFVQIRSAQQNQKVSRREASFKHPNAVQVINTLNDRNPANVGDLVALTINCLEQLSAEMHGSNDNSYKNFWNVDIKYGKPEAPRPENICRSYLQERLKALLSKYEVTVEPEAYQANEKRADIKLSFIREGKAFHLPIEVKRDSHKDLWKAMREQLIPFYTTAPETEGRGLYLVIWFNNKKLPTHPNGRTLPKSPQQLASMLKDILTPQEQKLINVFVLDVSDKSTLK